ncbi:hypothetical protein KAFR_0E03770 [Kazachstania africana CBS 2517]|uniref:ATP synthase f chain, mitochondrial n=1 Tax=Kazachstania africana (strain ATCC 22294 / BCRC 22015 / CBS 2517 / CECT 1963 / NBRC 1671 / NRRL Y-8276) TaxID=1071382 RepID=H2AVX8_KAZAF|nr:hypothetical protein KAFR_0E03770 [Kazachstania africana CBS 2517]CCF58528.1 hypothetical protein KAFR_0E03770 [Kazachstania africana CBS 2517]
MSSNIIFRRSISTLIPPKIVSAKQIGSQPNAKRVSNMVSFYKLLPRGPAKTTDTKNTGVINWYKAKYFNDDQASGKPLLHLCGALILLGYSMEYYLHLRHQKHEEHH